MNSRNARSGGHRRVIAIARRVMRQVLRDRRTVGLLVFVPMLVLALGAILFRADPAVIPLGVVKLDRGLPFAGLTSKVPQIDDKVGLPLGHLFDESAKERLVPRGPSSHQVAVGGYPEADGR